MHNFGLKLKFSHDNNVDNGSFISHLPIFNKEFKDI